VTVTTIDASYPPKVGDVKETSDADALLALKITVYVPALDGAVQSVAIAVPVAVAEASEKRTEFVLDDVVMLAVATPTEDEKVPPSAEYADVVETFEYNDSTPPVRTVAVWLAPFPESPDI